jgi:hypothetical protein
MPARDIRLAAPHPPHPPHIQSTLARTLPALGPRVQGDAEVAGVPATRGRVPGGRPAAAASRQLRAVAGGGIAAQLGGCIWSAEVPPAATLTAAAAAAPPKPLPIAHPAPAVGRGPARRVSVRAPGRWGGQQGGGGRNGGKAWVPAGCGEGVPVCCEEGGEGGEVQQGMTCGSGGGSPPLLLIKARRGSAAWGGGGCGREVPDLRGKCPLSLPYCSPCAGPLHAATPVRLLPGERGRAAVQL